MSSLCKALLEQYANLTKSQNPRPVSLQTGTRTGHPASDKNRFPLLAAYELCLKCSHLFSILDARGAISVTERVGVIARVRALAVGVAEARVDQQKAESPQAADTEPDEAVSEKRRLQVCFVRTVAVIAAI